MTEAAHQVCSNPVSSAGILEGSFALPTGVELRILDEQGGEAEQGKVGEVFIRGPNVMKGHLENEAANEKSFVNGNSSVLATKAKWTQMVTSYSRAGSRS
jgi:acyl-CoA synthetase (AMP-forming)/AMP-acid ligase II